MSRAANAAWLSLVGIGEDGLAGLSSAARQALAQAKLIVGGRRHLALIGATRAETLQWPSPLTDALPLIAARRGQPVAVLATGDPFQYGIGSTLLSIVSAGEMIAYPQLSAFALAANRLAWPQQSCALVSLHGRALERLVPHIQPNARILALSWDGTTPALIAESLRLRGLGEAEITVLEALGGPRERIRRTHAARFDLSDIDPLNVVAVALSNPPGAKFLPLTAGLDEDWFDHDGQITKRDIRAVTLAALGPRRGEILWDIGAGSGSIAIEWMLADPLNIAFAIEPGADRLARIEANARKLGVPDLAVVAGTAPDALAGLPIPDAIFIGGGATDDGVMAMAWSRLRTGGRLVANAVTLETQSLLLHWRGIHGGELVEIAVSRAEAIGGFTGWVAARPVVQWRVEKQS